MATVSFCWRLAAKVPELAGSDDDMVMFLAPG
eukprot:CAMPEP_0204586284 /NCGR_PEP_ID=MMETSP0661-20131031/47407_1 /ASSEMBLY_ACC=CAM_ASM_000606 /TAXON_ID=109239 /ORGANISM="Alexandrium margalefi, Strain AMGDE01CS-322" /LENGTH=31 /DNA_ID= /DNA_START= /DNA_END= /DNA_ORIENTATION=